jgi:hypothetical protein
MKTLYCHFSSNLNKAIILSLTDYNYFLPGHADENTTFINKLRKRVGLGGRSSSSQRLKNAAPKIEASGSMKHFSPANFLKRKR